MGWLRRVWRWLDLTEIGGDVVAWDPNSDAERALLERQHEAPHETRAVMRMHRVGKSGPSIMAILKITGQQLVKQMQMAMDEEGAAHRRKVEIHDAKMPKGAK